MAKNTKKIGKQKPSMARSDLNLKEKFSSRSSLSRRKLFQNLGSIVALPNLIEAQLQSYNWFFKKGLTELLEEVSPIEDYTKKNFSISFLDFKRDEPKIDEQTAKYKNASFEYPLKARVRLIIKETGEVREQEIYLSDIPAMTPRGTFIINGVERVVVNQLMRSPGVFFTMNSQKGRKLFGAKVIPGRGAWLEFETDLNEIISVKIDRKRKVPVTSLLRAFGYGTDKDIQNLFKDVDTDSEHQFVKGTLAKDPSKTQGEGYREVYKRIRPGDLATEENAKQLIDNMFFSIERYDSSEVGRHRLNMRLNLDTGKDKKFRVFQVEDLVAIVKEIIRLNNDQAAQPDDIDHLGNRRVRGVGELLQLKIRAAFARLERNIRDRMSTCDPKTVTPSQLINTRPITTSIKEFFSSSPLSQYMDHVNPLAELEHKRRLSAMGPGGLSRERAGLEVRDVHPSHYGRICPIQTPEGANIGLVSHLSCYARVNDYGFIETPYRKVFQEKSHARVSQEVIFMDALEEEKYNIAQANVELDDRGRFLQKRVQGRIKGNPGLINATEVDYIDVSPKQAVSIAASLIPFLEHDDANRALMGSNMQRQAVSCVKPESPVVGTGVEDKAAADSGQLIFAENEGKVMEVDSNHIIVEERIEKNKKFYKKLHEYRLHSFLKSNAFTSINQSPVVEKGDKVNKGTLLADGASTDKGELSLGQNLMVAFIPWRGYNFEDAVIISEKLVRDDRFSSIHIEDYSVDVRDTKLGPELVTRDIPNIGEDRLRNLGDDGIIQVGAEVKSGDILVGKITPRGEGELTAEERLLRAIFGEKSREVKDSSLYLPHGERGKVIEIKIFSRERGDKLPSGVIKQVQIRIAQFRKIAVGDKLAGRHGNKGVIARILPVEDMPFLPNGNPVDIILNPLGVASRMNVGQLLETHLGWAADALGYKAASPVLSGVKEEQIRGELRKANLPESGKLNLRDGWSSENFDSESTVGIIYIMKLHHLVEDKIHMRSVGPYSLITQQPLGGKAQFGGQRFGEMEVWALEGYGAAHSLQEILTIKSDDVMGRSKAYESIIKGEEIKSPSMPASLNVLISELKALCLNVRLEQTGEMGDKRGKNSKS
ncbi:MAG: DNA-directed RNA polymerase subunit beta [Candidatus Moraniibacteriota bacterium]